MIVGCKLVADDGNDDDDEGFKYHFSIGNASKCRNNRNVNKIQTRPKRKQNATSIEYACSFGSKLAI